MKAYLPTHRCPSTFIRDFCDLFEFLFGFLKFSKCNLSPSKLKKKEKEKEKVNEVFFKRKEKEKRKKKTKHPYW